MNYLFKKDDADLNKNGKPTLVAHVKIDEWERPSKGTELKLPVSSKTWVVVRVDPPSNPAGQQNTYFIEEV